MGEGQILFEALIGNVEEGLAAGVLEGFVVLGLESGYGAVQEDGVIGDTVDGLAVGDGFGELVLREVRIVQLFVEGRATGAS